MLYYYCTVAYMVRVVHQAVLVTGFQEMEVQKAV
jgi:hypothetical protein